MKRMAGVAAIAAMMCLSLVAGAGAHTVKHDSVVTLHQQKNGQDPDGLGGKVISDSTRCESDRTVKIYRRVQGPDELVGTTTTDADGNYELLFTGDIPSGTYYAVVTRKVLHSGANHHHVCKRATSNDLTVH